MPLFFNHSFCIKANQVAETIANLSTVSSERNKLKMPVINDEPPEYPKPDISQMRPFKPIPSGAIGKST